MRRQPWRRKVPRSGASGVICEERVEMDEPLDISSEQSWGLCEGLIAALCEADKCKASLLQRLGPRITRLIYIVKWTSTCKSFTAGFLSRSLSKQSKQRKHAGTLSRLAHTRFMRKSHYEAVYPL